MQRFHSPIGYRSEHSSGQVQDKFDELEQTRHDYRMLESQTGLEGRVQMFQLRTSQVPQDEGSRIRGDRRRLEGSLQQGQQHGLWLVLHLRTTLRALIVTCLSSGPTTIRFPDHCRV